MLTYQDLERVGDNEQKRKDFVRSLISEHQRSDDYKIAKDAYDYYCHRNVTINEYKKLLYTVAGQAVPDNYSANFKMACRHFYRFITQEVQHLLGNGISWSNEGTEDALGTATKSIDRQVKEGAIKALWGKVAFGFYDKDHVEIFSFLEFAPLFDEMDGSLKGGVRYWQIDKSKPLRATLYEIDGFTKYVWNTRDEDQAQDEPKRKYLRTITYTEIDGDEIYNESNYPTFPIVPFWANSEHQSALVGLREQIDCYDLIKSGFANTVDEASIVYWTIQNAGGMDDIDLAKFIKHMKTLHAATVDDDGAHAESHSLEAPYASREALLDRLDSDMYRDAMALNTNDISSGAVTATQILAAYEDLNSKCDDFEYQVLDFLEGILAIAGIDDEPTFTRSQIVNREEMISNVLQCAEYMPREYIVEKLLTLMGDADRVEDVLNQIDAEDFERFVEPQNEEESEEEVDAEDQEETEE